MCPPRGWCVRWPDVWGHGDRLCPGPAAAQKGREHTRPVVGLALALAHLASPQLQQLLRVGLLREFRGPGKWPGWAAGQSGSFRATRNTYVTVSEGRLGDEAKDKRSGHVLGWRGPGCPLQAPLGNRDLLLALHSPLPLRELSGWKSRGGSVTLTCRAVRLSAASPTGLTLGLARGTSQGTFVEWTPCELGLHQRGGLYRAGLAGSQQH